MKIIVTCLLFVVIAAVDGLPVEKGSFNPGSVAQAAASASAQSAAKQHRLAAPAPPREQYNYHGHHNNPYGNNRRYGTISPEHLQPQRPRSFGPEPQIPNNGPIPQIVLQNSGPRSQGSASEAVAIAKSTDGKAIAIAKSEGLRGAV